MAEVFLSEAERIFILHGVQDNLRSDGRGYEDYRTIEVETDVVPNASGSAHIRLANTDVLVGVKSEIGETLPDRPKEGRIEFFVDCSANATPKFEGKGGGDLAADISNMLIQAFDNQGCFDLHSLCVLPGQQCWVLNVDILLLECGGNLHDAVSLAVKAALFNTRIPRITANIGEAGHTELELSDDPYDTQRLDVQNVPLIITLSKIGHCHVVDATMEEEACVLARIILAVTASGTVMAMKKEGSGSLDPESVIEMVASGQRVGQALNNVLINQLKEEEKMGPSRAKAGFLH